MAENPLARLPLIAQLGVSVVLALLLIGGFYWLYYKEALAQQKQKEAELAEMQKQIRALEATANKLADFQREVQMLELMRRLQYLAAQSNLAVLKLAPARPVQKDFYQEVPIAIDLDGAYHNMGAFLDRISRIPRIINVGNLKIKAQSKPTVTNTVGISAVATTYVYQDAPPSPPPTRGRARR
jgi:type IV pilus assembly protein PilO